MILDDRLLQQQWVQELSNEDFRMLMYLFSMASKCGIVELNMRMLNFAANTGKQYTKEDLLSRFGNILCLIPGHDNTAIFPDWISRNWTKGRQVDCERNPLFKSIANELAGFGLTIEDVQGLSTKKNNPQVKQRKELENAHATTDIGDSVLLAEERLTEKTSANDIAVMFDSFWNAWPKSCPRKVDKKKCRDKFAHIVREAKDGVQMFNRIMDGLTAWQQSDQWNKDGGAYIMAPLRWLNGRNWEDDVRPAQNPTSANNDLASKLLNTLEV